MIPFMNKIFNAVNLPNEKIIVTVFICFFVFDCALSASAAIRMNARQNGVACSNAVEEFLDVHFSDEKMHQIYANSKKAE